MFFWLGETYRRELFLIVISSDWVMILSNILIITFRMIFLTWTTATGPSATTLRKKTVVTLVRTSMRPGQEAMRLVKLKFNKALVVFFFLQVTQRVSKKGSQVKDKNWRRKQGKGA
jgi:hypothetical protein